MTKDKLSEFRDKRRGWLDMMNGDDEHAISTQITALLDADLAFRTVNQARFLCEDSQLPQNGLIHQLIDRGFIAHQVFAIRRITEYPSRRPDRAVYSLPRIIAEIRANRALFTRHNYMCVDGGPYNESLEQPLSYHRHLTFDTLSKTSEYSRSPDDLLHEDVLKSLEKRLKKTKKVRTFANKVLAHGADPKTRDKPMPDTALCFPDLDSAYRAVISVAHDLSAKLLYGSDRQFMLTYLVDALEHFENPLCPPSQIEELRRAWHTRYKELENLERVSKSVNV